MPQLTLINTNPYHGSLSRPPFVPLGSLSVAACTPEDWDIKIIDERLVGPVDPENINPKPDLVGMGAMAAQAKRAADLARGFRKTSVPVVLGGMHFSALADHYNKVDLLAHIAVGEAESVWPAVIAKFEAGNVTVDNCQIHRCPQGHEHLPLDGMVLPRHLVDQSKYLLPTIQAGRGCPFNCEFCCVPAMSGHQCRVRPVDEVIEEIKSLPGNKLFCTDDNLLYDSKLHPDWFRLFFEALASQKKVIGKSWVCQARIEDLKDETLDLMVKAGCVGIFVGLESVAKRNSRFTGKSADVKLYADRIAAAHKRGLSIIAAFMIGFKYDGDRIVEETLDFIYLNRIDINQFAIMIPFPETRFEAKLIAGGRYIRPDPDDFRLWPYFSGNEALFKPYNELKRYELAGMLRELYQQTLSITGIARRLLPWPRNPYLNFVGNWIFRSVFFGGKERRAKEARELDILLQGRYE